MYKFIEYAFTVFEPFFERKYASELEALPFQDRRCISRMVKKNRERARKRDKEQNLPKWYIYLCWRQERCFYTGEKFSTDDAQKLRSLERIDASKGYVMGNVIPVIRIYNSMLGNSDLQDLIKRREQTLAKRVDGLESDKIYAKAVRMEKHYRRVLEKANKHYIQTGDKKYKRAIRRDRAIYNQAVTNIRERTDAHTKRADKNYAILCKLIEIVSKINTLTKIKYMLKLLRG